MDLIKTDLILFSLILDFGKGSSALKKVKELGALGETVFLGKGTVSSRWLFKLGAHEIRKEILIAIVEKNKEDLIYKSIIEKFSLDKPHKGIAFSIPLKEFQDIQKPKNIFKVREKDVKNVEYESIFVIIDKGMSCDVIEAAESASSTGGTVIHGRGSGSQKKAKLFDIEIEPEKDIILILSEAEKTEGIINAIKKRLDICEPSRGIIFTMDVSRTFGLYGK